MIVITTPTGQIGRQPVDVLLGRGATLRLIARDPNKLNARVRDRMEVVEGSHGDGKALDGAYALFWLVPPDPRAASVDEAYVGFARPALEVVRGSGVGRIVDVTALGRDTPQAGRAGFVTASLAMDDPLAASGPAFRAVTCPSFFDNVLRQVKPIAEEGVFFTPVDPDRKLPACATRDIAETAADLLMDERWEGAGHVAVLGPEDLSFNDMATITSDVLGRPVRCQQRDYDEFKAQMVGNGMSDAMAQGQTDMARAKNDGLDNAEPRTAGNTTPTTFRRWCEETLRPAVVAAASE